MKKAEFLPGLTPLRGMAALLVIFFHYNLFIAEIVTDKTSPIVNHLYLMVDLFFVLSGFIMCHVYGESFHDDITREKFWSFIRARFARIYPLHFAMLLVTIGIAVLAIQTSTVTPFTKVVYDFTAIPSQLLLLQGMGTHHEATWNTPTWSISVEWWAYVLFPLIVLLLAKTKQWSRWLLVLMVLVGYLSIVCYFREQFIAVRRAQFHIPDTVKFPLHTLDVVTGPAFLRCMCGFVLGMLLYELFKHSVAKSLMSSGYVFIAGWLSLFVLWQFNWLPDIAAVFIMGIIILSTAQNKGWVSRVLNTRFWQHMGDISYSLYLVHFPLILAFFTLRGVLVHPDPLADMMGYRFPPTTAWLGLVAMYALSIAVATLTYKFVEKPARAYLKSKSARI